MSPLMHAIGLSVMRPGSQVSMIVETAICACVIEDYDGIKASVRTITVVMKVDAV